MKIIHLLEEYDLTKIKQTLKTMALKLQQLMIDALDYDVQFEFKWDTVWDDNSPTEDSPRLDLICQCPAKVIFHCYASRRRSTEQVPSSIVVNLNGITGSTTHSFSSEEAAVRYVKSRL